jgi:hypothetical protein
MLYTKQQAADKINDINALITKSYAPNVDPDVVLDKLNKREVISIGYMVSERSDDVIIPYDPTSPTSYPTYEVMLKMKVLVLCPIGDAWTDDVTIRLLVLSGLKYDQSFFDRLLEARYESFKTLRRTDSPVIPDYELFEEFIKTQNESI